jgi:hypothetical protein
MAPAATIPAMTKTRMLIRFYEAKLYQNGKDIKFSRLLKKLIDTKYQFPIRSLIENSSDYQVRNLHFASEGREIRGYFVRFRPDVPLSGNRKDNVEIPVELADGHEILERNFFSLFIGETYEVLAFHQALEGGSISGLARYFSALAGDNLVVSFNDILTLASLDELLKGRMIKHIQFKIAKPRSKSYAPDPEDIWTNEGMRFMDETGATTFQAKLATRSPTRGLLSKVKEPLKQLLASPQTRQLKIKLSDVAEPIDLFAERIKARIEVDLVNGIPDPAKVYSSIYGAKARLDRDFVTYFGKRDEALD